MVFVRSIAAFLVVWCSTAMADPGDGGPNRANLRVVPRAEGRKSPPPTREDDGARGRGAAAYNLRVWQTDYSDEDGANVFWLTWSVDGLGGDPIEVYANGIPVVWFETGQPVVLPGNTSQLDGVTGDDSITTGAIVFELISGGLSTTDTIVGVGSQPFGDPSSVTCMPGPRDPKAGTCDLFFDIRNPRPAGYYFVDLDGTRLADVLPGLAPWALKDVAPGKHDVSLLGALSVDGSDYLGDAVTTSCEMICEDLPCDAPLWPSYCQNAFGPGAVNTVTLAWTNAEVDYKAVNIFVDDVLLAPFVGTESLAVIDHLTPGDHKIGLQGDCGDRGLSLTTERQVTVLDTQPTAEAPKDLTCRFTSARADLLVATWRNVDRAQTIDVNILDAQDQLRLVQTIPGESQSTRVDGTSRTDRLALLLHFARDGLCFTSELIVCTPAPPPGYKYLRGDCDGNSNLDITDAIFSLNRLFKGGDASHCEYACDSNSDEQFNLADAVFVLLHLFQGGPPPGGAYPSCDESPSGDERCSDDTCNR